MAIAQLTGPRLGPKSGKAERLVVLVHGYGADGNDLIGLAPHWQQVLPAAAFAAPNGPERCEMSPAGYQWFGITRMDPELAYQGVQSAAPILNDYIDQELDRLGLDETQLALVGFSQGTMMSLHIGLRRRTGPKAIIGYSGTLTGPEHLGEITHRPPVLLIHGDADEMIPVSAMHGAVQALGDAGLSVQWHVSHGIGHGIGPDGMDIGGRFLSDAFQGRLSGVAGAEQVPA